MNIRGPFGDQIPGPFQMTGSRILETHDRPKVTHREVHVMRHEAGMFGPRVDKYPDATGWTITNDGRLDVENVDSTHIDVASYPSGSWVRAWFPGAEEKIGQPSWVRDGEDESGEKDDVEPNPG